MLSVTISINGHPIMARSVVKSRVETTSNPPLNVYHCDDGTTIYHDPADGAVALAIKALQTIKEPKTGRDGGARI